MKKWMISMVFLLSLFALPMLSEASTTPKVMKATTSVQVKGDASNSAKNVIQISKGSLVIVTGEKNGFSQVSYNGRNGYVLKSNLVNATPTPKSVTRAQGLMVKKAPTTSSNTATTLQVKTVVEDYGKVNANYHLVQYGSVIGYAHKSALSNTKPTTGYITGETVSVFASANTKSTKRSTLTFGAAVKVHGTIGSWSYVTAGSKRGYISKSFIAAKKPVQLKGTKASYADIKHNIRYTTTLRDLNGNSVQAHFVALKDTFKYATWDDVWAGVNDGDALYSGNYKLALQLTGSKDVYFQSPTFNSYTYNQTRKMVYRIKGKTAKDTDFIAVAETWSSAAEGANVYYYQNGALKSGGEIGYFLRPKSIGNQRYQSASYAREEQTGYIFFTESFNPKTGKWTIIKKYPFFNDLWDVGAEHAKKFSNNANYYVK